MTWTKISGEFFDSPAILSVTRGARLLHVEAMTWCNRHGTDGVIPRHVLSRITDEPDVERAVKELTDAGLWTNDMSGWRITAFLVTQPSAEDVERTQQRWRERQRRQRQHRNGDHSLCDSKYCHQAAEAAVTGGVTGGVTNPEPYRAEPNRAVKASVRSSDGKGGGSDISMRQSASTPMQQSTASRSGLPTADPGSPTARKATGRVAFGSRKWKPQLPGIDCVDVTVGRPTDGHVPIMVSPAGDPEAATTLLRKLVTGYLTRQVTESRKLHGCPRNEGKRVQCILGLEGLEPESDDDDDDVGGLPYVTFTVPEERSQPWVDAIGWELVLAQGGEQS